MWGIIIQNFLPVSMFGFFLKTQLSFFWSLGIIRTNSCRAEAAFGGSEHSVLALSSVAAHSSHFSYTHSHHLVNLPVCCWNTHIYTWYIFTLHTHAAHFCDGSILKQSAVRNSSVVTLPEPCLLSLGAWAFWSYGAKQERYWGFTHTQTHIQAHRNNVLIFLHIDINVFLCTHIYEEKIWYKNHKCMLILSYL